MEYNGREIWLHEVDEWDDLLYVVPKTAPEEKRELEAKHLFNEALTLKSMCIL